MAGRRTDVPNPRQHSVGQLDAHDPLYLPTRSHARWRSIFVEHSDRRYSARRQAPRIRSPGDHLGARTPESRSAGRPAQAVDAPSARAAGAGNSFARGEQRRTGPHFNKARSRGEGGTLVQDGRGECLRRIEAVPQAPLRGEPGRRQGQS